MAKNEEKMSLPGHDEAREGASRERIVINLTTDKKKVVRNLTGRIENIFEGIQEPRWPRASNSLFTPLR